MKKFLIRSAISIAVLALVVMFLKYWYSDCRPTPENRVKFAHSLQKEMKVGRFTLLC